MARTRYATLFAYHEAGHAVVALKLGLRVVGITVNRSPHGGPVCVYDACMKWCDDGMLRRVDPGILGLRRRAHVHDHITSAWAGYCAERAAVARLYGGVWPARRLRFHQLTDYSDARRAAWMCGVQRDRRKAFVDCFERCAQVLVDDLWAAIDAVAQTLVAYRTLMLSEIRDLVVDAVKQVA